MKREYKIGETFELDGETLQILENKDEKVSTCSFCHFVDKDCLSLNRVITKVTAVCSLRKGMYFKKVENER